MRNDAGVDAISGDNSDDVGENDAVVAYDDGGGDDDEGNHNDGERKMYDNGGG